MGSKKIVTSSQGKKCKRPPALTPEKRENEIIADAYDLVAERIRNGTASSAETCHFLKLGSSKEKLEREILEKQKELLDAKTESLKSAKRIEELYADALAAMKSYGGSVSGND